MIPKQLRLERLCYAYAAAPWRLEDVSFELTGGAFLGIIGPNGAGKSTLLRLAAGLLRPASGRVLLDDEPLARLPRRTIAQALGYLPQSVSSTFDYTAQEVVALGRSCRLRGAGFAGPADLDVVADCLRQTNALDLGRRRLSQLSGGERQRVLLASVLAQEPAILLLDEPTAALDLHHQVAFFSLLACLAEKGLAVAVVTHDLNLASLFCRELLLLERGRTVRHGPVEDVINPSVLAGIYRQSIHVGRHPVTGQPIVLPLPPVAAAYSQEAQP